MNATPETKEPFRKYLETWAAALADVLQQVAAPDCRVTIEDDSPEIAHPREPAQGALRIAWQCSGALAGRQILRVSPESALALSRLHTGEASGEPDPKAAALLLRQVAGQAAGRLRAQSGNEIRFQEEKEAGTEWSPSVAATLRLEGGTPAPLAVILEIDRELSEALAASVESAAAARTGGASQSAEAEGANLPLLLDIELEASIRFGQKELLLKDVLNLRPGTVVELARRVNEPAELLVAGRLMARGEVVVVEGNYGLRITEILLPAERMAAIQS